MRRPTLLLLGLITATAACTGPEAPGGPAELRVLQLSAEPFLEIGVLEGDEDYAFQTVSGLVRLPSGTLLVADGGASELAAYGEDGTFLRRFGGQGEGPGEFRALARIHPFGADSVLAMDQWTGRASVFDTAGSFGRQVAAADLSGDSTFPMDVWLHRRFWIDGALQPGARTAVRTALSRLPAPASHPGYRFVKVAADGRLWIREPGLAADGTRTWTVVSPDGAPEAVVGISSRFDPQLITEYEILGAWRGENDVAFVRGYAVQPTGATRTAPEWLTSPPAVTPADVPDDFVAAIRGELKHMASAQEIHYSEHYTYTADLDSLESWRPAEDLIIDFVSAGTRGWAAVFTHPALDRICGLGYGYTVPAGWPNGGIVCSPDFPSSTSGGS